MDYSTAQKTSSFIKDTKYDAVIIGAGIGGLVCGCYLAKAGLKVLIVEQHYQPGGCCTSFKRNGFIFDVGVHYIGSLREGGVLNKILSELELFNRIKFLVNDPTDRIITPDKTVFIRQKKEDTKKELITNFPRERHNIEDFFNFVIQPDFLRVAAKTRNLTFAQLLNGFFKDYKLKAVLSILLGNLGLPPSRASALVATVLFDEYIFDGGYYPQGGVQNFPDLLTKRFKESGGSILFSRKVTEICTKSSKITGVKIEGAGFIRSKIVISNADATSTFQELLDCKSEEARRVKRLQISHSAFVIYLGLNRNLDIKTKHYTTWYFSTYDIDKCYSSYLDLLHQKDVKYFLCTFGAHIDPSLAPKGKSSARIFVGAEYSPRNIWQAHKEKVYEMVIKKVNELIPDIETFVEVKEIGTPHTFHRYTLNRKGSLYGWAATPEQLNNNIFPPRTSIENLYLVGHWVTSGIGQSSVALVALGAKNLSTFIKTRFPYV